MNRMKVFAIVFAVLLVGAAVAVVVLQKPGDDFASDLKRRPKCWVKMPSSAQGTCSEGGGRIHKGACYVPNWSACAEYY